MANRFARTGTAATHGVAPTQLTFTARESSWLPDFIRRLYKHDVVRAEARVQDGYNALRTADEAIQTTRSSGGTITDTMLTNFDNAAHNFNNDVKQLKYDHGKLGASVEAMFRKFGENLGIRPARMTSTKISGSVAEAAEHVGQIRGNLVERMLSKPFRLATKHSKLAMVGITLGLVAAGTAVVRSHRAHKTQRAMQDQMDDTQAILEAQRDVQAYGPAAYGQQQPVSYQNSVSPQEYAAYEAALRDSAPGSRVDALNNARQQGTAVAPSL